MFCIKYDSGETDFVGYDNKPCHSIHEAMTFDTKEEAEGYKEMCQSKWLSELKVQELK